MPRASESTPSQVDIAIVTILQEEYEAVKRRLKNVRRDPGTKDQPNQYAWVVGEIDEVNGGTYQVVLAMTLHPGTSSGSLGTSKTVARWCPRYVLLVGIAGGLPREELGLGDVVVSKQIVSYEYGKVAYNAFKPRPDFVYQVDGPLLRGASSLGDNDWRNGLGSRPSGGRAKPKLRVGMVGSGEKVIDDRGAEFFAAVEDKFPKLLAVEMEGAGAAAAIHEAKDEGRTVGFLMIRGISDMPPIAKKPTQGPKKGTALASDRDRWKSYAANAAASFAVCLISRGWPLPPGERGPKQETLSGDTNPGTESVPELTTERGLGFLARDELVELHENAVEAKFAEQRETLFTGFGDHVRTALVSAAAADVQMMLDLEALNTLDDDGAHLQKWLENANRIAPRKTVFERIAQRFREQQDSILSTRVRNRREGTSAAAEQSVYAIRAELALVRTAKDRATQRLVVLESRLDRMRTEYERTVGPYLRDVGILRAQISALQRPPLHEESLGRSSRRPDLRASDSEMGKIGIERSAEQEYKALARKVHPDRNPENQGEAVELMLALNHARDVGDQDTIRGLYGQMEQSSSNSLVVPLLLCDLYDRKLEDARRGYAKLTCSEEYDRLLAVDIAKRAGRDPFAEWALAARQEKERLLTELEWLTGMSEAANT